MAINEVQASEAAGLIAGHLQQNYSILGEEVLFAQWMCLAA